MCIYSLRNRLTRKLDPSSQLFSGKFWKKKPNNAITETSLGGVLSLEREGELISIPQSRAQRKPQIDDNDFRPSIVIDDLLLSLDFTTVSIVVWMYLSII